MKAKELEFIPVILGGDITTYSLARSFHEEYGIKSIAISTVKNWLNSYSSIIDNIIEPKMNDLDTFLKRLTSLGQQYLGKKKLILIACGDWYVRMIIENRDTLEKYYVIPYIQEELLNKLVLKDSFYDICEKTGVDYPKTFVYDVKEKTELDLPFDFPVIAKPASSAEYHYAEFPGKKKVFKFNSMDELKTMLSNLEKSSYSYKFLIQDFIPGDDNYMHILTCYVDQDSKVRFMSFGHTILEDHGTQLSEIRWPSSTRWIARSWTSPSDFWKRPGTQALQTSISNMTKETANTVILKSIHDSAEAISTLPEAVSTL